MSALDQYLDALVAQAEAAVGGPLDGRTLVCPDPARAGGRTATSYPTPVGTAVWCDPALTGSVTQLVAAEADTVMSTERWVELAEGVGAERLGLGNNRVLVGEVARAARAGEHEVSVRLLDRGVDADVEVLKAFVDGVSEEDLDEAEIDLDALDPFIVGLFEGGAMVAYSSGRPFDAIPEFDDIGVVTSEQHRGRGLGSRVVAEFVDRRRASDPTRQMLYRCNIDNAGSNGVAESLGFTLVHTIGAVRFPE